MKLNLTHDCPDEQVILDYLVGELGSGAARQVERHLKVCTDCALSADQLSEDFADVERAIEIELPLPPLRLAGARARLQQRLEAYETKREEGPSLIPLGAPWAKMALAAAVLVLLVGAAAKLLSPGDEPALTITEVLARAQKSVPTYELRPSMVRYQVEFAQLEPESVVRNHQLVIWTDPNTGGYASRLEYPDGSLRHAIWRRSSSRPALAYDAASDGVFTRIDQSDEGHQPTLLASMGNGIDCDVLANGFMRWLEGRSWQPVQVSNDFALLASDKTSLRLERAGDVLLVVAYKQVGELRAEVTLTLSAESYEPYSLRIHFSGPQGQATVKLVQNEVRFMTAAHLDTSVFEASLRPTSAVRAEPAPAPRLQSEPVAGRTDPSAVEARLRYALHEAGACLGEPVQVLLDSNGKLAVGGIVGTRETKARILMELERSDVPDSVLVDILTRAEAIANAAESLSRSQGLSAQPGIQPVGPTLRGGAVRSVPLTADLTAYFRKNDLSDSQTSIGEELGAFTEGAVDRADSLLQSAWALRRLAEHYGESANKDLSPEAAALVREMANDHLSAFAAAARKSEEWILPVLDAVAASRGVELEASGTVSQTAAAAMSWSDAFLSLFESANSIHKDTLTLVTVRLNLSDVSEGVTARDRSVDVDQTLRRLLEASRALGAEADRTTQVFAAVSDGVSAASLGWRSQH